MTNEERIIKYLDNYLSAEEKKAFEEDLKSSAELRDELSEYQVLKDKLDQAKSIELNKDYVDSILPEFHNRFPKGKRETIRKSLSYAFGVMLIFLISITILRTFFTDRKLNGTLEEFTESLNDEQQIELLESMNGISVSYSQLTDDDLVGLLENDLEINKDVIEAYNIGDEELISSLSETEFDYLYQEILNKNLLEEVSL